MKYIVRAIIGVFMMYVAFPGGTGIRFSVMEVLLCGAILGNLMVPMMTIVVKMVIGDQIRESHRHNARCHFGIRPPHAGFSNRCNMCPYKNRGTHGLACSYWDGYFH